MKTTWTHGSSAWTRLPNKQSPSELGWCPILRSSCQVRLSTNPHETKGVFVPSSCDFVDRSCSTERHETNLGHYLNSLY